MAEFREAEEDLKEWISVVVTQIDDPHQRHESKLTIPLDIHGTVFQEKVWQALMEIPPGETVIYTQFSHSLGHPQSST